LVVAYYAEFFGNVDQKSQKLEENLGMKEKLYVLSLKVLACEVKFGQKLKKVAVVRKIVDEAFDHQVPLDAEEVLLVDELDKLREVRVFDVAADQNFEVNLHVAEHFC
jgi:hypothetical protein